MHREGTLRADDGTRLFWQAWTPSEPRAHVVLVHGGAEHSGRYGNLVSVLVQHDFGVHALDLRGHGRSGGRRGTVGRFQDYLDDLDTFIASLAAQQPPFLIGYSLGGLICAKYAIRTDRPLAGLVLAGPALGVGDGVSPFQFRAARALGAIAPRLPLFRMDPAAMMQDPAVADAYRADPLVFHGRFDARLLSEFTGAMHALPEMLSELRLPLLVVHGAADVTASPRASEAAVRRVGSADKRLRLYEGQRHDIFNEPGHDRACADVTDWLERHVREPAAVSQ